MHHGPILTPLGKYDSAGGSPVLPWKNKAGLGVQIETLQQLKYRHYQEGLVYSFSLIASGPDAI